MYIVISNDIGPGIYADAEANHITDKRSEAFETEIFEEAFYTADKYTAMFGYEFLAVRV